MHRGLLIRQLRWEDGDGRRTRLTQRRFVHLVDMHLAGWRRPSRRRTGQGLWRSAPGSTGGSSTPACSGTRTSTTVIWRSSAAAPPVRRRLAGRFAAVALVSGRPATFLAEHAAVPGVRYLGLYGLQDPGRCDPGRPSPRSGATGRPGHAGRPARSTRRFATPVLTWRTRRTRWRSIHAASQTQKHGRSRSTQPRTPWPPGTGWRLSRGSSSGSSGQLSTVIRVTPCARW